MKKIIVLEVGDIMYNPEYNGLHEIREINENTIVLSGCCVYKADTKTTIGNYQVPADYVLGMKPVFKKGARHKFLVKCASVNSVSVLKDMEGTIGKSYTFYQDRHILHSWNDQPKFLDTSWARDMVEYNVAKGFVGCL